jgi:hypothetical protein
MNIAKRRARVAFATCVYSMGVLSVQLAMGQTSSGAPVIESLPDREDTVYNGTCAAAVLTTGNAGATAKMGDALSQSVRVEAFVGNQRAAPQQTGVLIHRADVISWSGVQAERDSSTIAVDDRGELAVESALGATNGLLTLTAGRIGTILVKFDMGRVDEASGAPCSPRHRREQPVPQPARRPSSPPTVDARPLPESLRQVPPWYPCP